MHGALGAPPPIRSLARRPRLRSEGVTHTDLTVKVLQASAWTPRRRTSIATWHAYDAFVDCVIADAID